MFSSQDGYKNLGAMYEAECWAVRKKEERELHSTEMRMLRWARGKTRLDHVRNVDILKEAHMYLWQNSSERIGLDGLDMCTCGIKMRPLSIYAYYRRQ